jgi:hypothetical protein
MLHRLAVEHLEDLVALPSTVRARDSRLPVALSLPGEVLACLAVELVLKAVLRGHGWCDEHLRGNARRQRGKNVGHDLARAQRLVLDAGPPPEMQSDDADAAVVEYLGYFWKERLLPYMPQGSRQAIPAPRVVLLCERLVAGTEVFCYDRRDVHTLQILPDGTVAPSTANPTRGCGCPIPDLSIDR